MGFFGFLLPRVVYVKLFFCWFKNISNQVGSTLGFRTCYILPSSLPLLVFLTHPSTFSFICKCDIFNPLPSSLPPVPFCSSLVASNAPPPPPPPPVAVSSSASLYSLKLRENCLARVDPNFMTEHLWPTWERSPLLAMGVDG